MAAQQARLSQVEGLLADPVLYEADSRKRLQELLAEQGALRKQLDDSETDWLGLQEALEQKEHELTGDV